MDDDERRKGENMREFARFKRLAQSMSVLAICLDSLTGQIATESFEETIPLQNEQLDRNRSLLYGQIRTFAIALERLTACL